MWEAIKSLVGVFVKTNTFAVSLVLVFVAMLLGVFEYQMTVTKRIKKRYNDFALLVGAVVCGVIFTVFSFIEFYPILLGMFKGSIIGVYGTKIMPHIYTVIPLLAMGVFFTALCYEVAKYTGKFKRWFLKFYRKNHKMYACRNH